MTNDEQKKFEALKKKIDNVAAKKQLSGKIKATVTKDGLLIRLLTDDLLFDSGSAVPRADALPLLGDVANLLATTQADHKLIVSGNTDSQPIHSGAVRRQPRPVDRARQRHLPHLRRTTASRRCA